MSDLKQTPPKSRMNSSHLARNLNLAREALVRQVSGSEGINVSKFGNRQIISEHAESVIPESIFQSFVVLQELSDVLLCAVYANVIDPPTNDDVELNSIDSPQIYDPSLDTDVSEEQLIYVAKPYLLQKTPWNGQTAFLNGLNQTFHYLSSVGQRVANAVVDPPIEGDIQQITPSYLPGDIITARKGNTGYAVKIVVSVPSGSAGDPTFEEQTVPIIWEDINTAGRHWEDSVLVKTVRVEWPILWSDPAMGGAVSGPIFPLDIGLNHTFNPITPGYPVFNDWPSGPIWTDPAAGMPCWTPDVTNPPYDFSFPTPVWSSDLSFPEGSAVWLTPPFEEYPGYVENDDLTDAYPCFIKNSDSGVPLYGKRYLAQRTIWEEGYSRFTTSERYFIGNDFDGSATIIVTTDGAVTTFFIVDATHTHRGIVNVSSTPQWLGAGIKMVDGLSVKGDFSTQIPQTLTSNTVNVCAAFGTRIIVGSQEGGTGEAGSSSGTIYFGSPDAGLVGSLGFEQSAEGGAFSFIAGTTLGMGTVLQWTFNVFGSPVLNLIGGGSRYACNGALGDTGTLGEGASTVGGILNNAGNPAAPLIGSGYGAGTPGNWSGSAPTSLYAALDRIAAAVAGLLGGPIP